MIGHWFQIQNTEPKIDDLGSEAGLSQGFIQFGRVTENNVLTGTKPARPGLLNIGIMPLGIASGAEGLVYLTGTHRVNVILRDGETLACYDVASRYGRVGSRLRHWFGQVDSLGPWTVGELYNTAGVKVPSITNSSGADMTVTALVQRRNVRGGEVFVRNHGESTIKMPAAVWMFGSAYTVSEYEPRKVRIDG